MISNIPKSLCNVYGACWIWLNISAAKRRPG